MDGYGGIEGAHLGGVGVEALVTASGSGGSGEVCPPRWRRGAAGWQRPQGRRGAAAAVEEGLHGERER